MKQNYLSLSALLLPASLLLLSLGACKGGQEKKNANQAQADTTIVETQAAATQTIDDSQTFSATVEAAVTNNISSQMGGRIKRIRVEVGQTVSRGQVLAEMDPSSLRQSQIQLEDQKANYARIDELYKVGGISKAEWESRKRALDLAQTSYQNLRENTVLTSPISGVVTARNYDQGDVTSVALPIFTVEQLNPVKLVVNVSEAYFPKVTKGMPVQVTTPTLPGEEFQGKVSLISPTIDPASHSFVVEVQVNNPNRKLSAGMYAYATLSFGTRDAVVVSDRSVVKQIGSGERYLFYLKNGKAVRQVVQEGVAKDGLVEILAGVQPGMEIVTEGASVLKDGAPVKVVNRKQ